MQPSLQTNSKTSKIIFNQIFKINLNLILLFLIAQTLLNQVLALKIQKLSKISKTHCEIPALLPDFNLFQPRSSTTITLQEQQDLLISIRDSDVTSLKQILANFKVLRKFIWESAYHPPGGYAGITCLEYAKRRCIYFDSIS